jgi:hypothetical protein
MLSCYMVELVKLDASDMITVLSVSVVGLVGQKCQHGPFMHDYYYWAVTWAITYIHHRAVMPCREVSHSY